MDTRTITRGAIAGMVGGMMMGMFAMLAMWLDGQPETAGNDGVDGDPTGEWLE